MLTRGEEFWIHLCALAVTTVVAVAIFAAPKSFIDACWVPKDQESYHVSSLDIKWQSGQTFFILYYSAQLLHLLAHSHPRLNRLVDWLWLAVPVTEVVMAHVFRLVVYKLSVLPVGIQLADNNCGTNKAISGHTHMYFFHMLFTIATVLHLRPTRPYVRGPSPPLVHLFSGARRLAAGETPCNLSVRLQWLAGLLSYGTVALALNAIGWTYFGGHHSVRHIVLGAAVGMYTLSVYQFLLALLAPTLLVWPVGLVIQLFGGEQLPVGRGHDHED